MPRPNDAPVSSEEARESWEGIADWWDAQVGEGNAMQRVIVWPAAERLLELRAGDRILEVACGNGSFARRLARGGASVLALDAARRFIEIARARSVPGEPAPEFGLLDATSPAELASLDAGAFDSVACLMGLMDLPEIDPLMGAIPRLLRPGGRFVAAVLHPCFNGARAVRTLEETDSGSGLETNRSVRVSQYAAPRTGRGIGIPGQPQPHFYFDRPLGSLLGAAFRAGLVLDALEEPTFPAPEPGSRPPSWTTFSDIPPALIFRLRPR